MIQYEITFIVDPVLSSDEIKATAQTYVDQLTAEGCTIVHVDEMGLRPLAYPINNRTSGIYYCVEFNVETGELIERVELSMRRDERIVRFLTVRLDKYGVKYNEDKRNGLIGTVKKKKKREDKKDDRRGGRDRDRDRNRNDRDRDRGADRNRSRSNEREQPRTNTAAAEKPATEKPNVEKKKAEEEE